MKDVCDDVISRQAAIDAMCKLMNSWFGDNSKDEQEEIKWIINHLPSAQQWTPCNVDEQPPEEGRDVLITKKAFKIKGYEQEVIKAKRSADPRSGKIEWWSEFGALTDKEVLAWMPTPKPYQGTNGGN